MSLRHAVLSFLLLAVPAVRARAESLTIPSGVKVDVRILAATNKIAIMQGGALSAFGNSRDIFEEYLSTPTVASEGRDRRHICVAGQDRPPGELHSAPPFLVHVWPGLSAQIEGRTS